MTPFSGSAMYSVVRVNRISEVLSNDGEPQCQSLSHSRSSNDYENQISAVVTELLSVTLPSFFQIFAIKFSVLAFWLANN